MNPRTVGAAALWVVVLVASMSPVFAGDAPESESELAGTNWRLREIEGRAVLGTTRATLTFESADKVGGDGGCNRFFGAVEIDGGAIEFGPLGSTRRACGEAIDEQEMSYLGALAKVAAFTLYVDDLLFVAADDTILLRFERAD